MIDLKVNLGGLEMEVPITTASGTFGYGTEYLGAVDYSKLGAVTVKGVRRPFSLMASKYPPGSTAR